MSTVTISQLPNSGALTGTEVLPIVQSDATVKTTVQDIADLAGLAGTNFIYVAADGTDTANATALSAAYTTAATMSPSATNRITIVAAPGYYNFGSTAFTMSTQYIDLVSLDGNRSVIFNSADPGGTISITANDVFVKGVNVATILIGNNLNLLRIENCKATIKINDGSIVSGTFIDCEGGNLMFGGASASVTTVCSGTFINCVGGDNSFGINEFNNSGFTGTAINCIGGYNSFGGVTGYCCNIFSGTATNCIGGDLSFGFGGNGKLSGKLYYCRITVGTFLTVTGSGATYYCIDGNGNPNNQGFTPQDNV
jgi:hypothetical protein